MKRCKVSLTACWRLTKYRYRPMNHVLDFGLYARKGGPSSISAHEFEGKSIAVTSPGSATDIFARHILAQYSVQWMREHSEETQKIIAARLKIKEQDTLQKIYSIYTKIWGTPNLEADQVGLKIALMYLPNPKVKAVSVDDLIYENNELARSIP